MSNKTKIIISTLDKLPERCKDCPCYNSGCSYCQADYERRDSEWRPFWCPLKFEFINYPNSEFIFEDDSQMAQLGH